MTNLFQKDFWWGASSSAFQIEGGMKTAREKQ